MSTLTTCVLSHAARALHEQGKRALDRWEVPVGCVTLGRGLVRVTLFRPKPKVFTRVSHLPAGRCVIVRDGAVVATGSNSPNVTRNVRPIATPARALHLC
jgi:hypothetical protein